MEKLNIKALALAGGITCAGCMACLGWAARFCGWGNELVEVMSSFYIGYAPTIKGGGIGALWGFADGAIAGALIAFIYNFIAKKK